MSDMMTFPNTVKEFMEQYKIVDTEKIYTNGADLVPIFRMMQWFEHVSATDKNVGNNEDCISRQAAIDALDCINGVEEVLRSLPPAQPAPCDDAVSRKDCLKALSNMMDTDGFRDGWAVSRANVECMLKAMPSVMPKQRTGHWIPVGMVEAVGGESAQWGSAIAYHKCSECDEQALRDDFEQEVLSDFCPHCGAKMRGTLWE